jgi:hypothetical protein
MTREWSRQSGERTRPRVLAMTPSSSRTFLGQASSGKGTFPLPAQVHCGEGAPSERGGYSASTIFEQFVRWGAPTERGGYSASTIFEQFVRWGAPTERGGYGTTGCAHDTDGRRANSKSEYRNPKQIRITKKRRIEPRMARMIGEGLRGRGWPSPASGPSLIPSVISA